MRSNLFFVLSLSLLLGCSGAKEGRGPGAGGAGGGVLSDAAPDASFDSDAVLPVADASAVGGAGGAQTIPTGGAPSTGGAGGGATGGSPSAGGTGGGVTALGGGPSRGGSGGSGGAGGATTSLGAQFTFDTGVVSFGIVPLGKTASGIVTLTNLSPYTPGTAVITTENVTTSGCEEPVPPRASCQLTITATPTATGPFTGRVTIKASPGNYSPLNVFAVATVTSQRFTVTPQTLPLGLRAVGEAAPPQILTVTAVDDLAGLAITPVGADVTLDPSGTTCTTTLARGASCVAAVNYTASAPGVSQGRVELRASGGGYDGAADDVVRVPVIARTPSGTKLSVDPAAIASFTSQGGEAGAAVDLAASYPVHPSQTVTVKIAGPNATDFVLTRNGCPGAAPRGMCTLSVGFYPPLDMASGTRTATLTVTVAAEGEASETASVPLTGTIYPRSTLTLSPSLAVNPSTSHLPPVAIGMVGTFTELQVTAASVAATGPLTISLSSSEFALLPIIRDGCSGKSLTAEKNYCYFAVASRPTSAGLKDAVLRVQGGDGLAVVRTMTGAGLAPDEPIVNPDNVDFGAVPLGQVSAPKTIILQNFGATSKGPLVFDDHNAKDVMFITGNTCTAALAPGASCALTVYFVPMYQGTLHREIEIVDGDSRTMMYITGTVADS